MGTIDEAAENLISRHGPLQTPVQEEIKTALHVTGLMISAYVKKTKQNAVGDASGPAGLNRAVFSETRGC